MNVEPGATLLKCLNPDTRAKDKACGYAIPVT